MPWVVGNEGDDVVSGGSGFDILEGDHGHDRLVGGEDNDDLAPGSGRDRVFGGSGEDFVGFYEDRVGVWVRLARERATGYGRDMLLGIEHVWGTDKKDDLAGTGGDNCLIGEEGDDFLDGRRGYDTLEGNEGRDRCANGEVLRTCAADRKGYGEGGLEYPHCYMEIVWDRRLEDGSNTKPEEVPQSNDSELG